MSEDPLILPPMGFAVGLDEEERSQLSSFGEFLTLKDGDVLIQEGSTQHGLFLVISGTFHVQTSVTGRSMLLGMIKAGDTVGEVNIFDPGRASASVVSHSISEVWKIERDSLERYLDTHPKAAASFLVIIATQLSKRLRRANEKAAMAREAMLDSF